MSSEVPTRRRGRQSNDTENVWGCSQRPLLNRNSFLAMVVSVICYLRYGRAFRWAGSHGRTINRFFEPRAACSCGGGVTAAMRSGGRFVRRANSKCGGEASRLSDRWFGGVLWSSRDDGDSEGGDGSEHEYLFPVTPKQTDANAVAPEAWQRITQSARDKVVVENDRLSPSPRHSPRHVAAVTLQALRDNDHPRANHGCEVAIRFSSSSNPASGFSPGVMRSYMDDPSLPFYRILGSWDEMDSGGDLEVDSEDTRAYQQIRVRRYGDPGWSTVNVDLMREDGCWLIERLWVDDKSVEGQMAVGSKDGRRQDDDRPLTLAELFDEDRLEIMSCKYKDYDPERLAAGDGDWLEEYPDSSLSPKAVALTCILSLRQNDDGTTSSDTSDSEDAAASAAIEDDDTIVGSPATESGRRRNKGCERVIRFCSPTNVASTLTPAHFAQYLSEPWYAILKEWDELAFHSEDISEDGSMADLVVLLRPDGEAWTSVNWELVKVNDVWLTEKIWVDDV